MSEVKILLCDDDPDLLALLIRRLKKMGIEPDTAFDGREAKSLVDANSYDVIVTDIYMPEATGLEVMQHAKQKDADTQVVVITSSATLDNAIDALNHGSFGYLTKPFDHLIVFDNMVSRAVEYRQLIVADKRRAEAQKRRGDMLEDEVAQRVQQLQKNQKGLLDLLGSLPDGILVVEQGGKVVLSSPVGEHWLAQDQKTEGQPIHGFINQVHAQMPEPSAEVTIDGVDLHLMATDFRDDGQVRRKAVIIREVEEDLAGAGSMVTETVMGIKKGLAALYEQGMGTEVVLNVANQFALLEQLQGWSGGTGQLAAAGPAPAHEAEQEQTPAPARAREPAPAVVEEQSPAPEASAQIPAGADEVTPAAPFTLPRERTPTGELDGPRLSTSELQDALRADAPPDGQQVAAEPPVENAVPQEIVAEPQIPPSDPIEETSDSSTTREEGSYEEPADGVAAVEALAAAQHEYAGPAEGEVPSHSETPAPAEAPVEQGAPVESPASAPLPDVETASEPGTHPAGAAATDEAPAPPSQDPELTEEPIPEARSFPGAEAGTEDVPAWIDKIEGSTDPDLLEDFEFETDQAEASFPAAQTSEVSDDDSMFNARVIPEEVNAKLKTPVELAKTTGDQEYAPPQHDGPITIQAAKADTQQFRSVLEGLSGTQILSGDYEKQAEESPKKDGDAVAEARGDSDENLAAEEGLDELRSAAGGAPASDVPEVPIEAPRAEIPPPTPDELRATQDPKAQPVKANWPPTLPSEDDDWDDDLDVSG